MSLNLDIEKTCAFTGHREITDEVDISVLDGYISSLAEAGVTAFLSGMAMGFDLIAAERVLELKKGNDKIKLYACIPCSAQQKAYPAAEKQRYEKILSGCDEVLILSEKYYNGCMLARNRFMVDNAGHIVAYTRKNRGGTYYTLKYAVALNRKFYFV